MIYFAIPFPMIDPVLISLGPIEVRWYSLAYILGIFLAYMLAKNIAELRLQKLGLQKLGLQKLEADTTDRAGVIIRPQHLESFAFSYAVIGVIAGGRIGYVLFYNLPYFVANPDKILAVWEGGMSFHGGTIGVALALLLFCWRYRLSPVAFTDIITTGIPIGLLLGRIANFINGELYGRASDVPWAVTFPAGGGIPRHPSQLYEAFFEGFLLLIVINYLARRTDALDRKGLLAGVFLIGYGVSRFTIELFREPDAHLGFIAFNLTMGMLLSIPMVFLGLFLIIRAATMKPHKT